MYTRPTSFNWKLMGGEELWVVITGFLRTVLNHFLLSIYLSLKKSLALKVIQILKCPLEVSREPCNVSFLLFLTISLKFRDPQVIIEKSQHLKAWQILHIFFCYLFITTHEFSEAKFWCVFRCPRWELGSVYHYVIFILRSRRWNENWNTGCAHCRQHPSLWCFSFRDWEK